MIIFLLIIIAVGVLLLSEPGKKILKLSGLLGTTGIVIVLIGAIIIGIIYNFVPIVMGIVCIALFVWLMLKIISGINFIAPKIKKNKKLCLLILVLILIGFAVFMGITNKQ